MMSGFQRSWFQPEQWMKAEDVVSFSHDAVKSKFVMFITGEMNRMSEKKIRKKSLLNILLANGYRKFVRKNIIIGFKFINETIKY